VTVRRDTDLHGRESEIALLRAAWEQAKQGHGNTILIEGEAGIGKTRLVDVLMRGLETEDAHFLYGSYPPTGGLGGLSESILGKFGEAGLEESLAPYLTVTPSLIPAFAALVKHEAPPTGSEPLGGDALHAIGCHLVRALAEEKPTIWIIEDLHSGPEDARGFLLALARAVGSHRVLLIATSRAELPEETMVNFQRLENFQRLALNRLGARDVIGLVQDALKSRALADKLGAQIAYKSDGVPFFVFELIRALKEGRLIKQMPDGSHVQTEVISDIEVPSAVKDLVESRLKNLTKEERALLDVGAVQGYEFEPDLVARVLELKKISVLQDLAEIERRTGLIHGEAGKCRFDQYQIQEVLYRALMPDLRTEYHAMLADAYADREEIEDDVEGDEAYFLADHHLRGSRPKAARPHLDAALDWLENTHRNDSAIELADRALGTKRLLKGADRVEMLLRKSSRLTVVGRAKQRALALDEALGLSENMGDKALMARVHDARAHLENTLGNYDVAVSECRKALELARESKENALEVNVGSQLATVLRYQGKLDEAYETSNLALEAARESGNRAGERRATSVLAMVLRTLGRYEEALARRDELLEQGEALENTGNIGDILEFLGRLSDSQEMSRRCLALARERGYRIWECLATLNLAHVDLTLGRAGRAGDSLEGALTLAREIGDRRLESYALAFLAQIETAHRFEDAIAIRREIEYRPGLADDLVESGKHEAARGDAGVATAHLDEALALGRELSLPAVILTAAAHRALLPGGSVDEALSALADHGEHTGLAQRMDARFALWKATGDPAHLEEAHQLLTYLRDNAPEEDRESMIENVPLHSEIWRTWNDRQ
jgi:tetratricopeptide (TPR) repeat protein